MLNTKDWKAFTLSELFDIRKGRRLTSVDQTEGNTPYVGAIDSNNGVSCYIGQEPIHEGNTISVSYDGSIGEAFYQEKAFWCSDAVNVFYPKFHMNKPRALFICTLIRKERYRFSYGRKWDLDKMKRSIIFLPATSNNHPDWEWIDSYMHSIYLSAPLSQNLSKDNKVETANWKKFKLGELFEIETGTDLIYQDQIEGEYPVVGHNESNNGITCLIQKVEGRRLYDHNITISLGDRGCFIAYVQPRDFYIGTRVKALISKFKEANIYNLQFVSTLINQEHFKFCYGRNATSKIPEIVIKLPVKNTDDPDLQFMENYIKSLPYGDCI